MGRAAGALAACLVLAAGAGCRRAEDSKPAPPPEATQAITVAQAAQACRSGLALALPKLEAVHPTRRLRPALTAVGESCVNLLRPLSIAAREAVDLGMPRRAEHLAAAARPLLPPTCAAADAAGPAEEVAFACPPPEAFALAEPLLRDLDAGTYVFALALREQLGRAQALDEKVDRVLSNLVLAAALEGEERRRAAAGAPK